MLKIKNIILIYFQVKNTLKNNIKETKNKRQGTYLLDQLISNDMVTLQKQPIRSSKPIYGIGLGQVWIVFPYHGPGPPI